MEQVRNRQNIRLIADPAKLRKAVSIPSYRHAQIINEDLVMVRAEKQKALLNKPIAMGFCILDLSKLIMYHFFTIMLNLVMGKSVGCFSLIQTRCAWKSKPLICITT